MQFDAERVHSECSRIGIEVGKEYGKGEWARDGYWIGVHIGHYFFSLTGWVKRRERRVA